MTQSFESNSKKDINTGFSSESETPEFTDQRQYQIGVPVQTTNNQLDGGSKDFKLGSTSFASFVLLVIWVVTLIGKIFGFKNKDKINETSDTSVELEDVEPQSVKVENVNLQSDSDESDYEEYVLKDDGDFQEIELIIDNAEAEGVFDSQQFFDLDIVKIVLNFFNTEDFETEVSFVNLPPDIPLEDEIGQPLIESNSKLSFGEKVRLTNNLDAIHVHPEDLVAAIQAKQKVRNEQINSSSSSVDTSTKDLKEKEKLAIVSALSLKKNWEFESRINPSESGSGIAPISDLQPIGSQLSSAVTISPRLDKELKRGYSSWPITAPQLLESSKSKTPIVELQLDSQSLDDKPLNNQSISNVSEILVSEILDQILPEETDKDQLKSQLNKTFPPILTFLENKDLIENKDLFKNSLYYPFDKATGKGNDWYVVTKQQNDIVLQSVFTSSTPPMSVVPRSVPSSFQTVRERVLTNDRPRPQKNVLKGSFFTRQKRVKPTIRRVPEYAPNPNCRITRPCSRLTLVATVNRDSRVVTKIENRPSLFGPSVINPFVLTGYPNRIYHSPISDKNLRKIQTQAYQTSSTFQNYTKYISQYNKNKTNKIDASEDQFQKILKVREFVNQLLEDIDNNKIDVQKLLVERYNNFTNAFDLTLRFEKPGFLQDLILFWKLKKIKLLPILGASSNYAFADRLRKFVDKNNVLKAELDEEIEKMELIENQENFNEDIYKSLVNLRDYFDWVKESVQDHILIKAIRAVFEPMLHKYIVEVKTHDFSKSIAVRQPENKARTGGELTAMTEPYNRKLGLKEALENPHLRGLDSDKFLTNLVCVSKYSPEQCKDILESYIYGIKGYSQNEIQAWLDETGVPSALELPFFDLNMHFARLLQYMEKVANNQQNSFDFIDKIEEKVTENGDIEKTVVRTLVDLCPGEKVILMLFYALQVKNSFIVLLDDNYKYTETYKTRRKIKEFWKKICDFVEKTIFNAEGYEKKLRNIIQPPKRAYFVEKLRTDTSILQFIERFSKSDKDDDGKQKALDANLYFLQKRWRIRLNLNKIELQKNTLEKSLIPDPETFKKDLSEFL